MRISTRGKVLLGFAAFLLVISFYTTTRTEAKEVFNTTFNTTFDSQQNSIQQFDQTAQQTLDLQSNNQPNTIENIAETSVNAANLSEARSFKATAYCLQGRTANGGGVRRGIVAADPRVLPLGTRIQINGGAYGGTYTVADTGGAVKGRILDIWVPSCSEAIRFGRKTISVSVLGGAKKSKSNS